MCGLLGYSGSKPFNKDYIRLLFYANEPRGKDSSGFYNEDSTKEFKDRVKKALGNPIDTMLAKTKEFESLEPSNLFIGHTRAATIGEKTLVNAHPFMYGDVVGAHNGTLRNLQTLLIKYSKQFPDKTFNSTEINVDSKLFYYYLANTEYGNLDVIKEFDGAAALIWRDLRDNGEIINIWKNAERPLHYVEVVDGEDSFMYISSERDPLVSLGLGEVKSFIVNRHYKIFKGKIISDETLINKPYVTNFTKDSSINTKDDLLIKDIVHYVNSDVIPKNQYIIKAPEFNIGTSISTIELNEKTFTKASCRHSTIVFDNNSLSTRKWKSSKCHYDKTENEFIVTRTYDDGSYDESYLYIDESFIESFFAAVRKKGPDSAYKYTYSAHFAESKSKTNSEQFPTTLFGHEYVDADYTEILEDMFGPEEDNDDIDVDDNETQFYNVPCDDFNDFIFEIGSRVNGNITMLNKLNLDDDGIIVAVMEDLKGLLEDIAMIKEELNIEE
jgi:predicted glutamine amidotransferase